MPDRFRQFVDRRNGGSHGRFDSGPPGIPTEFTGAVDRVTDIIGSGDNAPFRVDHFESDGGTIEKPYVGFFSSWFQNYTCDFVQSLWNTIDHLGVDTMGTVEAATRGASRTNPSRPYIDLPVEIAQIHEIPDIIRRAGESIISRVGQANLALQFGVQPVAEDLARLTNLQNQIARRAEVLTRARQKGGMRRTVVVDAGSAEELRNTFLQTDGLFIRENVNWWTGETVKVHARWTPDEEFSHLTQNDEMYALARRAVTGGIIDLSTIWELTPWSWLVDYFGNVGETFEANRNVVGMTLSDVAVMRHTVTRCSWGGVSGSDFTMSGFTARYETKTRKTSFVAPVLSSDNFLNSNQVGILASLAATGRY